MTRWLTMGLGLALMAGLPAVGFAQTTEPDATSAVPRTVGRYVEPEPSVIPLAWQLDVKINKVGRIVVGGPRQPIYYWYVVYTVSNPSNKPVELLPHISMLTDTLDVYPSPLAITPELFKRVKDATRSKWLEEPLQVSKVIGGADNARDTVAVFALPGDPKWLKLFFGGFSGEQWKMTVPGNAAGSTEEVMMEKIKVIEFNVPGNTGPDYQPPINVLPGSEKWTMQVMPPRQKLGIDLSRYPKNPIYVINDGQGPTTRPED